MEYALVDGERRTAEVSGQVSACPHCGAPVLGKSGTIRIKHWAHRGRRMCDHWWEPETEWHRTSKSQFPAHWREVRHKDEDSGEWHIADVKTLKGWIIELQHSFIKLDERRARANFYKKLVWVVDGTRRQKDQQKFFNALKAERQAGPNSMIGRLCKVLPNDCALFRDWSGNLGPVFFDFSERNQPVKPALWCLFPKSSGIGGYIVEFSRAAFVALHRDESTQTDHFSELVKNIRNIIVGVRFTSPSSVTNPPRSTASVLSPAPALSLLAIVIC